jgi:hypothetical protein
MVAEWAKEHWDEGRALVNQARVNLNNIWLLATLLQRGF